MSSRREAADHPSPIDTRQSSGKPSRCVVCRLCKIAQVFRFHSMKPARLDGVRAGKRVQVETGADRNHGTPRVLRQPPAYCRRGPNTTGKRRTAHGQQAFHGTFKRRPLACVTRGGFWGERLPAFLENCLGPGSFGDLRGRRDVSVFHSATSIAAWISASTLNFRVMSWP